MLSALNKKLLRDVWALRGQVIAISLVVACGIGAYIMSVSVLDSMQEAKEVYFERYRLADIFASVKRAPLRIADQIADIEGIRTVYPRIVFGATLDVPGLNEPATGILLSLPENHEPPLNALYLRQGRMPVSGENNTVVISEAFAKANALVPGDVIRAVINQRYQSLRIVGVVLSPEYVYSLVPGSILPDDKRFGVMWINRRALEAAADMDGAFNNIAIGLEPGVRWEEVKRRVDLLLAPYGGLDAYPREDQLSTWFIENELTQLRGTAFIVPIIFLSVASFLLNIVLSRQVTLEREQIGMLKALGFSDLRVGMHFMYFAFVVVVVGAALGIILGVWLGRGLTEIYTQYFRFPVFTYVFDWKTLFFGVLISLFAASVGTFGAVRRVAKLPPAEAMQPARPMNYKPMLAERFGFGHLFSQPMRMILRHLERKPGRAFLSVIGTGTGLSILIAASFFVDSLDFMLDVQFNVANRENVNLVFVEPQPMRAVYEAENLPGVLYAEPYRTVPVRLKFAHRSHRTALSGYTNNASLKRVIDTSIEPVVLPSKGVLLSTKLAEILDTNVGDIVTAEVLEGRRPVVELAVTGLVEEFIGVNAFVSLDYLNQIMGDPRMVSGAALLTTGEDDQALYNKVKVLPKISSSLSKAAMIESVEETMTESLVQTTIFNTLFAGLIAFGVIYNTARISFSERQRELASMKVLGFYHSEVTLILLGELILLVLISIPLGLVAGQLMAIALAGSVNTELFRIPVIISTRMQAYSVLVVALASMFSAIIVWYKMKKLDIVSVLKTRE